MRINEKDININDLIDQIGNDSSMIRMRGNGIYLSDNEIGILQKYNINYKNYSSLSSLIFDIEEILNEETDLDDLEQISSRLSEMNYYNNTNK